MFKGFSKDALKYFRDIEKNNNRSWYLKNKERYEKSILAPARELVDALNHHPTFRKLGLSGNVKSPLFRMARDTRFSSDKTPYKNYNGFSLSRSGVRGDKGVFYLHLQPQECFLYCGFWQPDSPLLSRLRLKAADDPKALKTMLKKLKSDLSDEDTLKRMPRGFEHIVDADLADFLKLKSYAVGVPLKESDLASEKLVEKAAKFTQRCLPLLQFGWPVLDRWRIEGGDLEFQEKLDKFLRRKRKINS